MAAAAPVAASEASATRPGSRDSGRGGSSAKLTRSASGTGSRDRSPVQNQAAPTEIPSSSPSFITTAGGPPFDSASLQLSDLEVKETVGTGTFGRVRLAQHKETGRFFALKILKKQDVLRLKQERNVHREVSILRELNHPFIVKLYKAIDDPGRLYMLLELASGGELFNQFRKAGKFPVHGAKFFSGQILCALEYLHGRNIIFRDLKPENLLLDGNGNLKMADFGFAKRVADRTYTLCGTPEYLAPELIQSNRQLDRGHGKPVDWWAFGIILFEMLVGYPPFFDESPIRIYEKILEGKPQLPNWLEPRAVDLIRGLLQVDPSKRLGSLRRGVHDIKKHKFYTGVDWDLLGFRKIPSPLPMRLSHPGDPKYFDRYPESDQHPQKSLTAEEQAMFSDFSEGKFHEPGG